MREHLVALWHKSLTLLYSDAGVTTVEWVALAAAMVIGAVGVAYIIMDGLATASVNIANKLSP